MRAFSFLKRNQTLAILSGQMMIMAIGVGSVNPVLPQYARTFGVSITLIGLVVTVFGITRLLSDIPASRLATKFGRRRILIIGSLILLASSLMAAFINNYWGLLTAWAVQGVGAGLFIVSAMIMLADISSPVNRGQVMATFQGSQLIGAGVGPVVGGFVAQIWGYQWVFIVFAIMAFLSFLISYFLLPETRGYLPPLTEKRDHRLGKHDRVAAQSGIKPLLFDLSFALISLVTLGAFIMRIAAQNQILPLLGQERMDLSSGQIGVAMTVIVVFQFTATFIGGRLSDRIGRKIIITLGCLVGAGSLLVLAQSYSFEMLLLSCIGMGIGVGLAGSTALAYVVDITPRNNYSTTMGLYRTITDFSFAIGPVLMGWLADIGGFSLALLFNSIFLFVVAIIFQIFARGTLKNKSISVT